MPQKKWNETRSTTSITDLSTHDNESYNSICLSGSPSQCSAGCASGKDEEKETCCNSEYCEANKNSSELPQNTCDSCTPTSRSNKGKSEKRAVKTPSKNAGNQTDSNPPCDLCSRGTSVTEDKSKDPKSKHPAAPMSDQQTIECCQDDSCPNHKPPDPPPIRGCLLAGCPLSCGQGTDDLDIKKSKSDITSRQSSTIRPMPSGTHTPTQLQRQGSAIATDVSKVKSTSILKNPENEKKKAKKKSVDSKTSVKSRPSICKCDKSKQTACTCHYPPAFQRYFQCTGTITGICTCTENK